MGSSKKKRKSKKKQFWGLPMDIRTEKANEWLEQYNGESLVKDYSKVFGLNLKNSLKELVKLGATISSEERDNIRRLIKEKEQQRINKRDIRKRRAEAIEFEYYDETYAFIAGYTEGGAPYGITHEEMEEIQRIEEMDDLFTHK
jgi:hypothetical protein